MSNLIRTSLENLKSCFSKLFYSKKAKKLIFFFFWDFDRSKLWNNVLINQPQKKTPFLIIFYQRMN